MAQSKTARLELLSGWKEIANYLGKGVRTVQRYEREHGLPVRRPTGGPRGSVIATLTELDAWVRATPIRDYFVLAAPKANPSAFAELQAGIQKMQQLCAEMKQFRSEMRVSIDTLHSTIHGTARARTLPHAEGIPPRLQRRLSTGARRPN